MDRRNFLRRISVLGAAIASGKVDGLFDPELLGQSYNYWIIDDTEVTKNYPWPAAKNISIPRIWFKAMPTFTMDLLKADTFYDSDGIVRPISTIATLAER